LEAVPLKNCASAWQAMSENTETFYNQQSGCSAQIRFDSSEIQALVAWSSLQNTG